METQLGVRGSTIFEIFILFKIIFFSNKVTVDDDTWWWDLKTMNSNDLKTLVIIIFNVLRFFFHLSRTLIYFSRNLIPNEEWK